MIEAVLCARIAPDNVDLALHHRQTGGLVGALREGGGISPGFAAVTRIRILDASREHAILPSATCPRDVDIA